MDFPSRFTTGVHGTPCCSSGWYEALRNVPIRGNAVAAFAISLFFSLEISAIEHPV
jgi:hypothetical protein